MAVKVVVVGTNKVGSVLGMTRPCEYPVLPVCRTQTIMLYSEFTVLGYFACGSVTDVDENDPVVTVFERYFATMMFLYLE
jgi:hypothetical protein